MPHTAILNLVETHAHAKEHYWLTRAKGLLQSDLWVADGRLDSRQDDEAMLAERDRL